METVEDFFELAIHALDEDQIQDLIDALTSYINSK